MVLHGASEEGVGQGLPPVDSLRALLLPLDGRGLRRARLTARSHSYSDHSSCCTYTHLTGPPFSKSTPPSNIRKPPKKFHAITKTNTYLLKQQAFNSDTIKINRFKSTNFNNPYHYGNIIIIITQILTFAPTNNILWYKRISSTKQF